MTGAIVFGRQGCCPVCVGRGWTARGDDGRQRAAFPSEITAHARGVTPARPITPCRTCGATGLVSYRRES